MPEFKDLPSAAHHLFMESLDHPKIPDPTDDEKKEIEKLAMELKDRAIKEGWYEEGFQGLPSPDEKSSVKGDPSPYKPKPVSKARKEKRLKMHALKHLRADKGIGKRPILSEDEAREMLFRVDMNGLGA